MSHLRYQLFPRSFGVSEQIKDIILSFDKNFHLIDSEKFNYNSNQVLEILRLDLEKIGFKIEKSKKRLIKSMFLFCLG